eukprot:gb/GECG01002657.1/.p1 GENE.gb/GECG01002657.1/~~gb/GECG01002657.1/.p1  ORF type:complete len:276 (+),score=28.42 gb/GECG01002657.1/:1-828(+)
MMMTRRVWRWRSAPLQWWNAGTPASAYSSTPNKKVNKRDRWYESTAPVVLDSQLRQRIQNTIDALPRVEVKPMTVRRSDGSKQQRRAAVFVPLINAIHTDHMGQAREELSVLFTIRTDNVSTHKGQVSFPGGHIDDTESAHEAALREFTEEVNCLPEQPVIFGSISECIAVTGTHVTPVVGYVPGTLNVAQLLYNRNEVSSLFSLPVSSLTDYRNFYMEELQVPYGGHQRSQITWSTTNIPVYLGGPERVWGLTAYILEGCLRDVILPSLSEQGK